MKLKIMLMTILLGGFMLSACSGLGSNAREDLSSYEKIHRKLTETAAFKAEADIEYISNKGSNKYETMQYGKNSGEYRIEITGPENVAGNITLSDGKQIGQFNPNISGKVLVTSTESRDRLEILFTTFIQNYLKSHEISINASTIDESHCTVFEATIPGDHAYLSSEKLWVDNESLKPLKLVIYDPDGSERVIVTYKKFEYNPEIEDNLFTVQ